MSTPPSVYVIDANVLMQAHRLYYAFPICPGFWDFLLQQYQDGHIVSVDKVRAEIDPGDALFQWVQSSAPPALFGLHAGLCGREQLFRAGRVGAEPGPVHTGGKG
jgi:hypothetical protein